MSTSLINLNDFKNLFSGNMKAYGVHNYKFTDDKQKEKGTNFTKTAPVIDELYQAHLDGDTGLGIIPIKFNTCQFAALDVDVYNSDMTPILNVINNYDLPLIPFRSKSGGLHLFLFFLEPVKAVQIIAWLDVFRTMLCLDNKTEIFPKQANLGKTQIGNWINLPYYNANDTQQYAYDTKHEPIALEHALDIAKRNRQSEQTIIEKLANLPLADAPPCLQAIHMRRTTDFRNQYLFSLARYYKTKHGDDFEHRISEANSSLKKPIGIDELQKTIISAHKKRDYSYKCKEEPIVSICNKKLCKAREFGIGGEEVSELNYGDFNQYMSDPPYYKWTVNDKDLIFYAEKDFISQQRFRELCVRHLHRLPLRIKEHNWVSIVDQAIKNMVIKNIGEDEDISPGSIFKEHLAEFFEHKVQAQTPAQILIDRVYKDKNLRAYIFKPKNLMNFLIREKQFREFGQTEIQQRLRDMKCTTKRYYIDSTNDNVRVWLMPYESLKKFVDVAPPNVIIDFKENYEAEEF